MFYFSGLNLAALDPGTYALQRNSRNLRARALQLMQSPCNSCAIMQYRMNSKHSHTNNMNNAHITCMHAQSGLCGFNCLSGLWELQIQIVQIQGLYLNDSYHLGLHVPRMAWELQVDLETRLSIYQYYSRSRPRVWPWAQAQTKKNARPTLCRSRSRRLT